MQEPLDLMTSHIHIRPATVRDVPPIAALISVHAQRGIMLFRSHAELYESIREFIVAENPDGRVVGICALEIVWADLAEVRSLAVADDFQKRGIGRALVDAVIDDARRMKIARVFSLTYEQRFFERSGFHVVDKSALPQKVWSVCIKCAKRLACDEIAMVRVLSEAPPIEVEDANELAELRYDVPTPLVQIHIKGR